MRLLDEQGIEYSELKVLGSLWATVGQMANLELQRRGPLKELIPLVNLICGSLDRSQPGEDLAMTWFVDGLRVR